jgi:hypothetical protein
MRYTYLLHLTPKMVSEYSDKIPNSSNKTMLFKSEGERGYDEYNFAESSLFPKGTIVELTGKQFPIPDNELWKQGSIVTFGGKQVVYEGNTNDCHEGYLDKYGGCLIKIKELKKNAKGGKRTTRKYKKARKTKKTRRI